MLLQMSGDLCLAKTSLSEMGEHIQFVEGKLCVLDELLQFV